MQWEVERESKRAWDQCAALFITAAVHQLWICVRTEVRNACPPASLPLFLCFPQEGVLMMLSFITPGGERQAVGLAKTCREPSILITFSAKVCQHVRLHFFLCSVSVVNAFHWLCRMWPSCLVLEPISSLHSSRAYLPPFCGHKHFSAHMELLCLIQDRVKSPASFCRSSKICPAWLFRVNQGQKCSLQLCCFNGYWRYSVYPQLQMRYQNCSEIWL